MTKEAGKQTERMLIAHCRAYPKLQIRDVLKFLHQSAYGCEHLVSDEGTAFQYIKEEAALSGLDRGGWTEELDGAFCRVHLDWVKAGLCAETLGRLFVLSARPVEDARQAVEEKVCIFQKLVDEGVLPFDRQETEAEIETWREAGYPACRHSDEFRERYAPAYRVIKKEYAMYLPLFLQVDRMRNASRVTLAIEGGSASGKTTAAALLEAVYGATVFHMDDFFLRPEQRTPERLATPGGNVDYERFLEEVLTPLKNGEAVSYRRFDCQTLTLESPVTMPASEVTVIEGAYSMHPELAGQYNLSVFLEISPQLQERRIRKRNSPVMAKRFFKEWIPMERNYFEATGAKERCDLSIKTDENFSAFPD